MSRLAGLPIIPVWLLLALAGPPAGRAAVPEALRPLKTDRPPLIDGRLDDPVWAEAPAVSGFKTFIPDFGRQQPEATLAYLAYDSENLYFAFRCFEEQPEKIKASLARRDSLLEDDFVCINLDSFGDQQSLYAFYVNPLGVQGDSRYAAGKEDFSVDLVWESAGRIDDRGYAVELRIPLKSIRYHQASPVRMGLFLERFISRRQEHGSYPALDPQRGYAFLTQLAPIEYRGLKRYTLLELLPAFTLNQAWASSRGRLDREPARREVSLTGKYGITSSLVVDGAYNPDFSQVEADAGQVDANLRYDLFYPEKRPFFLEGSESFNVGATDFSSVQSLVHTRTIVDPRLGLKLTGKLGARNTVAAVLAVDEPGGDPEGGEDPPRATFTVLRYKRTIRQDGYLGALYSAREQGGGYNRVAGGDGLLRLSKAAQFSFHAFFSDSRPGAAGPRRGGHTLSGEYLRSTDQLTLQAAVQDVSGDFRADTGYVTRTGISQVGVQLVPKIYPRSAFFRRLDPVLMTSHLRDHGSGKWETANTLGLTLTLKGNNRLTVQGMADTEIFLGRRFKTGGFLLSGSSQVNPRLSLQLSLRRGWAVRYSDDPFQASGSRVSLALVYLPAPSLNLTLSAAYADLFRCAGGAKVFDYAILRGRFTYQPNRRLFLRAIAEYNAYYQRLLTDLLASFTYIPGTVLQLGYGSLYQKLAWEDEGYRPADRFREMRRGLFFKASYLWRL